MLYIGIDLGTSAVKLLLMNEKGEIKNVVSREYDIFFPQSGWSEQNPEDWFKEVLNGIDELTVNCDKNQIAGIGAGGQMHGLVILDKENTVIRPAILWNDGRTNEETDYLNNKIGKQKLSECTGNIAFAGFTAPKILWLKKHEPEAFSKIDKISEKQNNCDLQAKIIPIICFLEYIVQIILMLLVHFCLMLKISVGAMKCFLYVA